MQYLKWHSPSTRRHYLCQHCFLSTCMIFRPLILEVDPVTKVCYVIHAIHILSPRCCSLPSRIVREQNLARALTFGRSIQWNEWGQSCRYFLSRWTTFLLSAWSRVGAVLQSFLCSSSSLSSWLPSWAFSLSSGKRGCPGKHRHKILLM